MWSLTIKAMLRPTIVFLVVIGSLFLAYRGLAHASPGFAKWLFVGLLVVFVGLPLMIWLGLMIVFMVFAKKPSAPAPDFVGNATKHDTTKPGEPGDKPN